VIEVLDDLHTILSADESGSKKNDGNEDDEEYEKTETTGGFIPGLHRFLAL